MSSEKIEKIPEDSSNKVADENTAALEKVNLENDKKKMGAMEIEKNAADNKPIVYSKTEALLIKFNIACGSLHTFQWLITIILSFQVDKIKNFRIPIYTHYLKYIEDQYGNEYPIVNSKEIGDIPFATITTFFALLSGIAHGIILLNRKRYIEDLRRGINFFRWYEYAVSSSLMIVLIAMLFGVYDLWSIIMMASVNACMNLFGLMQEEINLGNQGKTKWTPFWYGCFAGLIPWIVIFAYLGSAATAEMPDFVWGILGTYLVFFNTFPINMFCQYAKVGPWNDTKYPDQVKGGYMFGEKLYQIQSLVSKSVLLWLVIGGVNQPNKNTTD